MSVATELRSQVKLSSETRAVLGVAGNRVRVLEEPRRVKEGFKKPQKPSRLVSETPQSVVRSNVSVDSSCSSDSSSSGSSLKKGSSKRRVRHNGLTSVKVVPDLVEVVTISSVVSGPVKRCDWITANSDPLYTSFHDEEWGVPVYDDRKLFELLVLSQALAEFTWPALLKKREIFRKLFDNFDPSLIAKFDEKKILSLKTTCSTLLSEPKLRAVVENANQMLKVQQEFGSFSTYCWGFVNNKPIRNGFRYARQVPARTPKAELISKDLMQRGFRCVGPIIVYSFMQVAGLVNDHLVTCFRYQECNGTIKPDLKLNTKAKEVQTKAVENAILSDA